MKGRYFFFIGGNDALLLSGTSFPTERAQPISSSSALKHGSARSPCATHSVRAVSASPASFSTRACCCRLREARGMGENRGLAELRSPHQECSPRARRPFPVQVLATGLKTFKDKAHDADHWRTGSSKSADAYSGSVIDGPAGVSRAGRDPGGTPGSVVQGLHG